jgi:hypothetical protein
MILAPTAPTHALTGACIHQGSSNFRFGSGSSSTYTHQFAWCQNTKEISTAEARNRARYGWLRIIMLFG